MGMEEVQLGTNKEHTQQRREASASDALEDESRLENVWLEEVEGTTLRNVKGKKPKMFI